MQQRDEFEPGHERVTAKLGDIAAEQPSIVVGMAANGAQYGVATVNYYWIGAIPAMVFLGLVMMPFYYNSKVRSVPEFLLLRFSKSSHLLSSVIFAVASVLIAGVNLYALAIVLRALLGWPLPVSIFTAGLFVLAYIVIGGLSSAIYNEVLQFFVIVAALIPLTVLGLVRVGGIDGLIEKVTSQQGEMFLSTWAGTGFGETNPLGTNWLTITLGLGFAISFGYWTTNFAEVQRALSARSMSAARRTPIIAAFPKALIPLVIVIPGMIAGVLLAGCGDDTPARSTAAGSTSPATVAPTNLTAADGASAAAVTVRQFQFMPAQLVVRAGTSVTWTNQDDILHTATSGASPGMADGQFDGRMDGLFAHDPPRIEEIKSGFSIHELARQQGIDMPITAEVYRVLFEGKSPLEATTTLMLRPPKDE